MNKGEELALNAMKKELARLERLAAKAKDECDEYMNIGSEMIAIHEEFSEIVKSKDHSKETSSKLDKLSDRSKKASKIRKKDLIKLMDKESDSMINVETLKHEVSRLEFRYSLR